MELSRKWGYSSSGLSILFSYVDVDSDGTLDIAETGVSGAMRGVLMPLECVVVFLGRVNLLQ